MRLVVNVAQLAGLALFVVSAAAVSLVLGGFAASVVLCGLSWVHDPDRRAGQ